MSGNTQMCPHCGLIFDQWSSLTPIHLDGERACEGSQQNPRCSLSDGRPLWNGQPNPHFAGGPP